jgi:hypothetical protein
MINTVFTAMIYLNKHISDIKSLLRRKQIRGKEWVSQFIEALDNAKEKLDKYTDMVKGLQNVYILALMLNPPTDINDDRRFLDWNYIGIEGSETTWRQYGRQLLESVYKQYRPREPLSLAPI